MFGSIPQDSPLYAAPLLVGVGVYMTMQDIWVAFVATVVVVVVIALHGHGRLVPLLGNLGGIGAWVINRIRSFTPEAPTPRGMLHIGRNLDTGEKLLLDVGDPSSMGIYAQTGSGKSTLVETILAEIATGCNPSDLKLCISDPSGVDYRIWDRLPHLAYPIVDTDGTLPMLQWVMDEKRKREALFASMPRDRKCNNLNLYHKLRDDLRLSIPKLPVIIVILDEVQDVAVPGSESETILKDFARTGRKFGIVVWAITQRNTVDAISRSIQQQQPWKLIGYMADNQDYATVARVPKDVYTRMKQAPGRFIGFIGGQWFITHIRLIKTKRVEQIARTYSLAHDVPYPQRAVSPTAVATPQVKRPWQGKNSQKKAMVVDWLKGYQIKPTPEDFMGAFDVSLNTAKTWLDKCWAIVEKQR